MPQGARPVIFAMLLAGGCAPAQFGWDETGPPDVGQYRGAFVEAVGARFLGSLERGEWLDRVAAQRVLWLGDHHRSTRLHALQRELLEQLHEKGMRMVFALEAIGRQDEPDVRRYLRGDVSLDGLREAMRGRWAGSWLDDPDLDPAHYGALLEFARRHGVPVLALEPTPRLSMEQRDETMAAAIRAAADAHAGRLLVVHVGQAHLAGRGDLVARTGLPGVVLGGEPPEPLRTSAPARRDRGSLWQSSGGMWWFAELFGGQAP